MWHFGNLLLRPKLCVWVCYRRGRKVTSSIIVVWGLRVAEQLSLSSHQTHRWSFYWEGCCFEQTYNGFSRWDQTVPDPSTGFDHFPPHFNSLNSLYCIKMKTLHNDNYMFLWYYEVDSITVLLIELMRVSAYWVFNVHLFGWTWTEEMPRWSIPRQQENALLILWCHICLKNAKL